MSDLIDRGALLREFRERQKPAESNEKYHDCDCFFNSAQELSTEWWCVEDVVEAAPAVDAVPVVHAYWMGGTYCSNCRAAKARPWAGYLEREANTYCHACGAKMDGGDNDV